MSTNTSQTQQSEDDSWKPSRIQDSRRVYLVDSGKSRYYEFDGRQKGETVKVVLRKDIWFLITPAFPVISSTVALIAVKVVLQKIVGKCNGQEVILHVQLRKLLQTGWR